MTFNKTINNYSISEKEKKQIDAKIKVLDERMNAVETTANTTASVVESIVTGDGETIVPVASGGTSATTSTEARNELLGDIPEIVSEITDATLIAGVYPNTDTTSGKIGKRTIVSIYNYIKSKFVHDNLGTGSNIDRSDTDPTSIADTFDAIEDDIDDLNDDITDIGTDVATLNDLVPEGATSSNQLVDNSSMTTALTNGLATKQNALTAGSNIDITGNVISANIANVYIYCGSVATYADLPSTDLRVGDVYNVEETEMNYGWNGTAWDQLGSNAVIADNAVTTNKIADNAVTTAKINNSAVTTAKINDGAVTLSKVGDDVVSYDVGCICTTAANVQDKEIILDNFVLKAGVVLKVLFLNSNSVDDANIKIKDSNNNVIGTYPIYAVTPSGLSQIKTKTIKTAAKVMIPGEGASWQDSTATLAWDSYTTLELMFDEYNRLIVMGNPVLLSGRDQYYYGNTSNSGPTGSYVVYASGLIEQWRNTPADASSEANLTWSFHVTFSDTNYLVSGGAWLNNYGSISLSKHVDYVKYTCVGQFLNISNKYTMGY